MSRFDITYYLFVIFGLVITFFTEEMMYLLLLIGTNIIYLLSEIAKKLYDV